MDRFDALSEAITQQELQSSREDIYSSEERAKAESLADVVEDFFKACWNKKQKNSSMKTYEVVREELIQKILEFL